MRILGIKPKDVALLQQSPLFDDVWYLAEYPDVAHAGISPVEHYLWIGASLRRNPSPAFDSGYYLDQHADVRRDGVNPLVHFLRFGKKEGRTFRSVGEPAAVVSTPILGAPNLVHCPVTGNGLPDLFSLKAATARALLAIIVYAPTRDAVDRLMSICESLATPVDLIVVTPSSVLAPSISSLGKKCAQLIALGIEQRVTFPQVLAHIHYETNFSDYAAIAWLDLSDPWSVSDSDVEALSIISSFNSGTRHHRLYGSAIVPTDVAEAAPAVDLATSFASRLNRSLSHVPPALPSGPLVMFPVLISHQLKAYSIHHKQVAQAATPELVLSMTLAMIAQEAGLEVAASSMVTTDTVSRQRRVRTVAFYLPQFHPVPENDRWWGAGFTEWTNVTKATPVFDNHHQPNLPADLGFYDLRTPETQESQSCLAAKYGVHAFCYYYYWFNGRKMLERPIEQMVERTAPDQPFCVCWANENWSRNWDGQNKFVLLEQEYTLESSRALIHEFIRLMRDPRYLRYKGRPVLVIYRIRVIPNWLEIAKMWRDECEAAGIGKIHLCAVRFGLEPLEGPPAEYGVDQYVLFPPHEASRTDGRNLVKGLKPEFTGEIFEYDAVVDGDLERFSGGYPWPVHRGVMLGWDNTPRRQNDSRIFVGATPARFAFWINNVARQDAEYGDPEEALIFINAWNEWAEGTTLEPNQRFGHGYLEGVRMMLESNEAVEGKVLSATLSSGGPANHRDNDADAVVSYEVHPGRLSRLEGRPTILLCAHVVSDKLFGGERSYLDMLEALERLDVNVVAAMPTDRHPAYTDFVASRAVAVVTLPYRQIRGGRAENTAITEAFCAIIKEFEVDAVYANTTVLLEPLLAARNLGKIAVVHAREIISLDCDLADQLGHRAPAFIRDTFERTDFIVANSVATQDIFFRPGQTFCVPNVVDHAQFDMNNVFGSTINFAIISSNIPKKGVSDFIEVARICADRDLPARFLVIGPKHAHLDRLIRLGLPRNVEIAGYEASPRAAMSKTNVVISLSHFAESFGRTVAEGLAARRPVIAYDWGAVPELIEHGKTGFLAPYRDTLAVADYCERLCRQPDLIRSMGEAGRAAMISSIAPPLFWQRMKTSFEIILGKSLNPRTESRGLTIIVPIYNAFEAVSNCIQSLKRALPEEDSVRMLLIDDGSSDGRIGSLLDEADLTDRFHVIRNPRNLGYTRTINLGIEWAGTDDVVLLNSDTIVTPGWIDGLRAAVSGDRSVGTVTAMSDNAGAFSFPIQGEATPKPDHISHDEFVNYIVAETSGLPVVDVPTGSGFCMYIRRDLFEKIGLFDAELFPRGYGEENDFCMRALAAGFRNVISSSTYVFHVRSASFGPEKETLIKGAVDTVTRKHPEYAAKVKAAFASSQMRALREAVARGVKNAHASVSQGHTNMSIP